MEVMRFAVLVLTNLAWFAFQVPFGFYNIVERFGIPLAFSVVIFVYFSRALDRERTDRNEYRDEMLDSQKEQVEYLRQLVANNQCKFKQL